MLDCNWICGVDTMYAYLPALETESQHITRPDVNVFHYLYRNILQSCFILFYIFVIFGFVLAKNLMLLRSIFILDSNLGLTSNT